MPVVLIDPVNPVERRQLVVLGELARSFADLPWVLIGGQMVRILELEHGSMLTRPTIDIDALIDVRVAAHGLREAAVRIETLGFVAEPTLDGLTYRFARGDDVVDILGPDNLGSRADLMTTPHGRTFQTPGGTQALARRRDMIVKVSGDEFVVPIPTLLGAIIIKARAAATSQAGDEKHRRDLARLLALVVDVEAMRIQMRPSERRYIRQRRELQDLGHRVWRGVPDAEDGIAALLRLGAP